MPDTPPRHRVRLNKAVVEKVVDLAIEERRTTAGMANLLLAEALEARMSATRRKLRQGPKLSR